MSDFRLSNDFFKIELAEKHDLIQKNECHSWIQHCQIAINQLKNLRHQTKKNFL